MHALVHLMISSKDFFVHNNLMCTFKYSLNANNTSNNENNNSFENIFKFKNKIFDMLICLYIVMLNL